jgi:hypothetical protein
LGEVDAADVEDDDAVVEVDADLLALGFELFEF